MKQNNTNIGLLIAWSSLYVTICSAIMYLLCTFGTSTQRFQIIIVSIGILSILLWFVLLVGFSKFDGSNDTWWSKLVYDFYPYTDRKKRGSLFLDVVFPAFIYCFVFSLVSFPLFFACIVIIILVGYLLYNPIGFLFNNCQLGFYSLVSLVIITIMLSIFHSFELKKTDIRFNRLAILRSLFGINIYIIGYVLLLAGFAEGYNDVLTVVHAFRSTGVRFIQLGTGIAKPFFNILPGALLLYHCRRNINILLYVEDQYYLYLRSFQYDEKDNYLMSLLPVGDKQKMRIGNPSNSLLSTFLSNRTIDDDVLFLPSSNWQKHLDYYIYKAYSVICVVDDTQGVVWEMFYHSEYYNKIVFWVDSREKLSKLANMVEESIESDLSPQLYYCIRVLNERDISFPFVFWIKDNRCYYETDVKIVTSLMSSKLNNTSIYFFDIDSQMDKCVPEEKIKGTAYYEDWNNYSRVLLKFQKFFNLINSKLPLSLLFFCMFCSYLICLTFSAMAVYYSVKTIIEGDVLKGILSLLFSSSFMAISVYGTYDTLRQK